MKIGSPAALLLAAAAATALVWIYWVDPAICNGCGLCVNICSEDAIYMYAGNAVIDPELCNGCGICAQVCPRNAISKIWYQGTEGSVSAIPVTVGPNPTSGPLSIAGLQAGQRVHVISIYGRAAATGLAGIEGDVNLDLGDLPEGLYLLATDFMAIGSVTLVE